MNDGQRVLIFSGGRLGEWALKEIRNGDFLVGADRGALFLIRHRQQPYAAIGDFDSVTDEELAEIRQNSQTFISCDPVMKDWTDTEMALNWVLQQRPREVVLLGALGTRFDHSLANVHLLWKAKQAGVDCKIVDEYNEITLVDRYHQLVRGRYSQVSLLPLSMKVSGITLEGFYYPLRDATLAIGESLGISNVLSAETGHIHVKEGLLLVIQSVDSPLSIPR